MNWKGNMNGFSLGSLFRLCYSSLQFIVRFRCDFSLPKKNPDDWAPLQTYGSFESYQYRGVKGMSGAHIQIADAGQNLTLPNHGHDPLPVEQQRDPDHDYEAKRADFDEKELHHDVDEKDTKAQHVTIRKPPLPWNNVDNGSASPWTPSALVSPSVTRPPLLFCYSCANCAVTNDGSRLAYQSMGVIYGDIGTSPLYVYSSTFRGEPSYDDLLGALSLIIWAVTLMVTVKYVMIVLWANDEGEGGTFAVYSLLSRYVKALVIFIDRFALISKI